jgi:hypothetical protein
MPPPLGIVVLTCLFSFHEQILLNNEIRLAEVYFFVHISREEEDIGLALVSLYSNPDPSLLDVSCNTLWSCEYQGDSALKFIDAKSIKAVVAMVPHTPTIEGRDTHERFFLVEKPGFDVALMAGVEEDIQDDEGGTCQGNIAHTEP